MNFVLFVAAYKALAFKKWQWNKRLVIALYLVLGGLGVGDRHSLWCAVAMVLVVMHIFRRVKSIHMICAGLARAIPGVLNMIILMVFLASGFARIGVAIFAGAGAEGAKYFGTFFRAMLTMFQVFTPGSNWAEDIARPLMSTQSSPAVSLFFIVYLILFWLLLGPIVTAICLEKMADPGEEQEQPDSESEEQKSLELSQVGISEAPAPASEPALGSVSAKAGISSPAESDCVRRSRTGAGGAPRPTSPWDLPRSRPSFTPSRVWNSCKRAPSFTTTSWMGRIPGGACRRLTDVSPECTETSNGWAHPSPSEWERPFCSATCACPGQTKSC